MSRHLPCILCSTPMEGIVSYDNISGRKTCWRCEQGEVALRNAAIEAAETNEKAQLNSIASWTAVTSAMFSGDDGPNAA